MIYPFFQQCTWLYRLIMIFSLLFVKVSSFHVIHLFITLPGVIIAFSLLNYTCLSFWPYASIPKFSCEALFHPYSRQPMINKMSSKHCYIGTGSFTPVQKYFVGCCWLYTLKFGFNGKIYWFKAHLAAKRYTYIIGLYYSDPFLLLEKITYVRFILRKHTFF